MKIMFQLLALIEKCFNQTNRFKTLQTMKLLSSWRKVIHRQTDVNKYQW